jgi:hypothetical protein
MKEHIIKPVEISLIYLISRVVGSLSASLGIVLMAYVFYAKGSRK